MTSNVEGAGQASTTLDHDEVAFLTKIFAEETLELLADIDPLFMSLDQGCADPKVVDLIYRKVHTVKGGSGVTPRGAHIGKLCHELESCLNAVKSGGLIPDAGAVNIFLGAADLARRLGGFLQENLEVPESDLGLLGEQIVKLQQLLAQREKGLLPVGTQTQTGAQHPIKPVDNSELLNLDEDGVFVSSARLDDFVRLSGEFIIFKNYFELFSADEASLVSREQAAKALKEFSQGINKLTGRLQDQIMDVRKVVLTRAFGKLPRMIRQTCQDLGKRVRFVQSGLDLGVDKRVAKALSGAMTHMVRNSLDHGMETPAERQLLGKPEEGSIFLAATETKGVISVVIRDDGKGINKTRVVAKALGNGLLNSDDAAKLSEREIFALIFLPGFSTAEAVTDVSGRGVGMDAVRATVEELNGTIEIQSTEGVGTEITIAVPIPKTVVIEKTIVVESGGFFFAVPITAIAKIDNGAAFPLTRIGDQAICQFDGGSIRAGRYGDFAGTQPKVLTTLPPTASMVILQHRSARIALIVDAVKSQLEAVVRPFDGITKHVYGCKGTTVIGTSQIAYVLSPEEMVGNGGLARERAG